MCLVIRGAPEAVWSLQCLLRWKVFLCRRGSADLATDLDLQDQLVSALFVAPSGATSCWRSHRDLISTLNNTKFYLWSKTIRKWKIVLTAFQSGPHWHFDWLHPLFEVEQLYTSGAAERDGLGIKPAAELQRENWHRRANFCSSRAQLIFILSPLKRVE